jgi:ribosome maturation factor RimP
LPNGEKMSFELLKDIVGPVLEEMGIELVDLQVLGSEGRTILRVYVDQENGISLERCTLVSREIADILDRKDPMKSRYILEVSSPGLDRPLKTRRDFERNLNKNVKIKYKDGDKGSRVKGKVKIVDDSKVVLEREQEEITIDLKSIELAKLVIEF